MSGEIPSHVVASIAFVGRTSGLVKTLSGFRKPQHSIPDAVNSATNAFLARICSEELAEMAERLFQEARTGLAYKRKDISLSVTSPSATLAAKDFSVEIVYALDERDPAHYRTTTTLRELHDVDLSRTEAFQRIFAGRFTEIEFGFEKGARIESIIDAIEALPTDTPLTVDYPSDCSECVIRVPGVDAQVRCTSSALQVVFPRGAAPDALIDAFALIRDAFQISKVLTALIDA